MIGKNHSSGIAFIGLGRWVAFLAALFCLARAGSSATKPSSDLWVLKPVLRPLIPAGTTQSTNPIDAFITAEYRTKGLKPSGPADRRALLRRVYLDLIGLPPTPAEQDAFLRDPAADAYERVVDRLLSSEQHGVRYARHWLDVLRYADADERMIAAPGIYLWRDWVVNALNEDLPYDQFVRAQLTGYRSNVRTQMSATGYRSRMEPRPDDLFALGFLARGAVLRDGKDAQELSITAVETVSTAFMGLTVGCAKCHDHMYDPIKQRDFYAMKALFDPLVVRKVTLATPAELIAAGKTREDAEKKRAAIEVPINELVAPYKKKLYEARVAMLPPDAQTIIRKPEKERTPQEQKIADDYFPILRIDSDKIVEIMPEKERKKYQELQRQLGSVGDGGGGNGKRGPGVPAFWTVEVDHARELEKFYILTSGDPARPEKNHEVEPGWPFAPANIDFRDGKIEAFSDWLTAPENPMFARVAANRIWQWHFGEGLERTPNDFGELGGMPSNPELLDWLASELISRNFSMKQLHRLIVTSDTYKLASEADPASAEANAKIDPGDKSLWHFRLQRLEAEPVWDSILSAAGNLDLTLGGPSFAVGAAPGKRGGSGGRRSGRASETSANRRAAYMIRGYSTSQDIMPAFLQAFDVDDGRAPCPVRTQTVTAPQALFMMNSAEIEKASAKFAERLEKESGGDLIAAVDLAYEIVLSRPPSSSEKQRALGYLEDAARREGVVEGSNEAAPQKLTEPGPELESGLAPPSRGGDRLGRSLAAPMRDFAWLLFNLDEFVYVR